MQAAHKIPDWAPKGDTKDVGLDYDDTYTAAPGPFGEMVRAMQREGHRVYFVTYRGADEFGPVIKVADMLGIAAVATDGAPKMRTMDNLGVSIDIWIDDMPELIFEDQSGV